MLERLERQGVFTTGLLLEVSETRTRRQNLASFGTQERLLFTQARIIGLADLIELDRDEFRSRLHRAARELGMEPPSDITIEGWWEQARTLEEE
jgi:hypothetical protein